MSRVDTKNLVILEEVDKELFYLKERGLCERLSNIFRKNIIIESEKCHCLS